VLDDAQITNVLRYYVTRQTNVTGSVPHAGSGVVRIDPLRFLA